MMAYCQAQGELYIFQRDRATEGATRLRKVARGKDGGDFNPLEWGLKALLRACRIMGVMSLTAILHNYHTKSAQIKGIFF